MIDWSTWATWGRGEAAERAVYASRNLDMGDGGGPGVWKARGREEDGEGHGKERGSWR